MKRCGGITSIEFEKRCPVCSNIHVLSDQGVFDEVVRYLRSLSPENYSNLMSEFARKDEERGSHEKK